MNCRSESFRLSPSLRGIDPGMIPDNNNNNEGYPSMMTATNGFRTSAAAIDASGNVTQTGTHTYRDDESQSASGEVAGTIGESHGQTCLWPSESIQTPNQAALFILLAYKVKAEPCPYTKPVGREAEDFFTARRLTLATT